MKVIAGCTEAAQYALLCRISAALRHQLVGQLQPISLSAALADRQLRADRPNFPGVRDSISKLQLQTREAIGSAIATFAWLSGEEPASVALKAGIDTCITLISADCEMRGVAISSQISEMNVSVSQRALRIVLTASLIAMVDMLPRLCRIELRSAISKKTISIHFDLHFSDVTQAYSGITEMRLLTWGDVAALADNEGVEVSKTGNPPLICRFDVVTTTRSEHRNGSLAYNP